MDDEDRCMGIRLCRKDQRSESIRREVADVMATPLLRVRAGVSYDL